MLLEDICYVSGGERERDDHTDIGHNGYVEEV